MPKRKTVEVYGLWVIPYGAAERAKLLSLHVTPEGADAAARRAVAAQNAVLGTYRRERDGTWINDEGDRLKVTSLVARD